MTGVYSLVFALVALSLSSYFVPLAGRKSPAVAPQEKLVILTPHWDGIRNEFRRGFMDYYKRKMGRSLEIEYLDQGGSSDCIRYIVSEFRRSPQGIGVDLFFGGGTDPYLKLKREGYLAPIRFDDSILAGVPQNFSGMEIYDADGYWYGAVLSGFGIVYNKVVARWLGLQEPREWKDLADPRLASWVGAADPRNSGTMHLMFEIILQAYGWQEGWKIVTGIAANVKSFAKGANEIPKMVAKGDMALGLSIDFYGWAQVSEAGEDKVGFILPRSLTNISADAVGMLRGAPNADAAREFIAYVLSEEGQKLWFLRKGEPGGPVQSELNRMAIRPDFYSRFRQGTNVRQNPFESPNQFQFNNKLASERWALLNDLIGVALIDNAPALKAAWMQSGNSADSLWSSVPISQLDCVRLAGSEWNDPVKKNRILIEWQKFFGEKYRRLARARPVS